MREHLGRLEATLAGFYKGTPAIPKSYRAWLVKWLHWISLLLGILSLGGAWRLWSWWGNENAVIDYTNNLNASYGGPVQHSGSGVMLWLSMVTLLAEGLLYLLACTHLKRREREGWDLLLYAVLVNLLYGLLATLSGYSNVGILLVITVASGIALYLLYQVKGRYNHAPDKPKV